MHPSKPTTAAEPFFNGLIDYAGLFPPAALPVDEAVRNYRAYLDSPDRWILGRFIITPTHLEKVSDELLDLFSREKPLDLSLVTRAPGVDLPTIAPRLDASGERLRLSCLEVPLDVKTDFAPQLAAHEEALRRFECGGAELPVFYEVPMCERWEGAAERALDAIAAHQRGTARQIGFKLRCGGVEAHLVPSPERAAGAIAGCARRNIPIKFTAGLHKPFRHDPAPGEEGAAGVPMHGYFNIFFAALAAAHESAAVSELTRLVGEMGSLSPAISAEGIAWLGHTAPREAIRAIRSRTVTTFGSCSFIEPIDEARRRGWL